jgi:alkanesulfonate monooxygenase SsuD/methylene tetrahydromethanopterin reductase-like flavin-dependent oxidoreductase (luciferase family)
VGPVDLGITLPTSGPQTSLAAIVRIAQAAEELGYTAVWRYERLLYPLGNIPQPGGPPVHVPLVLARRLARLADRTTLVAEPLV